MKKLSAVMLAAMCLTVGGVYATWTYAESPALSTNGKLPITLSSITAGSTKGTIDMVEDSISFTIDQDVSTDAIKMQYKAKLVSSGSLSVSFTPKTPDQGVSQEVYNNGIVLKMVIKENLGLWNTTEYPDNVDILQYVDTDEDGENYVEIDETNNCVIVTLNEGMPIKGVVDNINVAQYLRLGELYLQTPTEYYAFNDYISAITDKIHIYIADAETPLTDILATQVNNL